MRDELADFALATIAWAVQALVVFVLFIVASVVLRRPSKAVGRHELGRYGLPQ